MNEIISFIAGVAAAIAGYAWVEHARRVADEKWREARARTTRMPPPPPPAPGQYVRRPSGRYLKRGVDR